MIILKVYTWKGRFVYHFQARLAGQLCIKVHWYKIKCCWVWHRLIGALTHQLLPSCGRQRVGVAASPQTAGAEAGRWTKHPPPPCYSVTPCACSVLPAGSPCSNTMVDRIKVTFLAVTVADNLSHEFNMLWMEYSRKVLIIWHGLIPTHHLVLTGRSCWDGALCCPPPTRTASQRLVYFHYDDVGDRCGFRVYI